MNSTSTAANASLIPVRLNGEAREIGAGLTLEALLAEIGFFPERVAIELNGTIIKRELWSKTTIPMGSTIEVVQFVGGG